MLELLAHTEVCKAIKCLYCSTRLLLTQDPSNVCAVLLCKRNVSSQTQPFPLIFVCCCRFFILPCQSKIQWLFSIQGILPCVKSFSCVSNFRHRRVGRAKIFSRRAQLQIHSFGLQKFSIPFLFQLVWHAQLTYCWVAPHRIWLRLSLDTLTSLPQ